MKRSVAALALVVVASCATDRSARYVQFTMLQATLNDRAADALDAGFIDSATARRILALSEAVSRKRLEYRDALASGNTPALLDTILAVIERLLARADLLLPAPELIEGKGSSR